MSAAALIFALVVSQSPARDQEVARATEKLKKAVTAVKSAAEQIEKPKPVEADFTRARAALDSLKAVLDEGNQLEAKDLGYARLALDARKELRIHRERIERRRLEIRLAIAREDIGNAVAEFESAAKQAEAKGATDAQFARARAAADEVMKALERSQTLVGLDPEFTKYVEEVHMRVEARRKALDERMTEIASAAQQVEIEAVRKSLAEAVQALSDRNPSDELFEEATKAANILERMLARAEALPAKSRLFTQYLADMRKSLASSTKEIEKRKFEVQLPRQRRRVEEARAALAKAVGELKGNDVPEEKFTAAEAAARNAEKILEEGALFARRDREYAAYSREATKRIRELVARIPERRKEIAIAKSRTEVESARKAFSDALERIRAPQANDADFDEANTAAIVLEKTLEAAAETKRQDSRFAVYWADSKKYLEKNRGGIEGRRIERRVELQRTKIETELDGLSRAMSGLETLAPNDAAFKAANDAKMRAERAIEEGAELEKKVARYATWANNARKVVAQAGRRIEMRQLELDVAAQTSALEKLIDAARTSVETALREDATEQQVAAARASVKNARDDLAKAAPLEKRDKSYAAFAAKAKETVGELDDQAEHAGHLLAFRKGPIASLAEGLTAMQAAEKASGLEPRRDAYAKALSKFEACKTASADLIAEHPKIANAEVAAGGARMPAKQVIGTCGGHAESAEEKLSHVQSIIDAYEGPVKSLEQAKAALDKVPKANESDKKAALTEALGHLERCLEKGKILQYKHPKLADYQLDVGGKKVTLPSIVNDCGERAKAVRSFLDQKKS